MDIIGEDLWLFDSHDLIELAKAHGGETFIAQHPNANASMNLGTGIIMNQPAAIWNFSLHDQESSSFKSWIIDAKTGDKIF